MGILREEAREATRALLVRLLAVLDKVALALLVSRAFGAEERESHRGIVSIP